MKRLILFIILLYISQPSYSQWNRVIGIGNRFIYSIRKVDNYLFAATDSGIYRSDDGKNWQIKTNGIVSELLNTRDFCKDGNKLYAALMTGVYVSTDYGENWLATNYPDTPAISIYAIDNIVLASTTGGGLYRSTDAGENWNPIIGDNFWRYAMINSNLFASSWGDIIVSADTGLNWQSTNFNHFAYDLLNFNDTLLFTTFSDGIVQMNPETMSWTELSALQIDSSYEIANSSDTLFVSARNRIYWFKDIDKPANIINLQGLDVFPENILTSIEVFNNLLFIGTQNQSTLLGKGVWYYPLNNITGNHTTLTEYHFRISPNPANSTIHLDIPDNEVLQINILNTFGERVISTTNQCSTLAIDISALSNGIYVINLTSKNRGIIFTEKIIKI
jgi:hypothetical protein